MALGEDRTNRGDEMRPAMLPVAMRTSRTGRKVPFFGSVGHDLSSQHHNAEIEAFWAGRNSAADITQSGGLNSHSRKD